MKKRIALIVVTTVLLSVFSLTAFSLKGSNIFTEKSPVYSEELSVDVNVEKDIVYDISLLNNAVIKAYNGTSTHVVLPSAFEDASVTKIDKKAFYGRENLETVIIPDTVKSICDSAFTNCTGINALTVPESVTDFGNQSIGYVLNGTTPVVNNDFVIYGITGSKAQNYAAANGINFIGFDFLPVDGKINGETKTLILNDTCSNIADLLTVKSGVTLNTRKVSGNLFGTGSLVSVNSDFSDGYSIVIKADIDGDGVRDVLDASLTEKIMNNHYTSTPLQRYAANGSLCDEVDITSYQNVVNTCLGE